MRDFMAFCLQILSQLVSLFFDFSLGGYSYGNFLVVTLLVGTLVGALVVRFGSRSLVSFGSPPRHTRKPGRGSNPD